MEKQIAQIRNKMIGLIAIIALGCAWQWDFIAEGVMSHVYTTGSILSAFAFSIVTARISGRNRAPLQTSHGRLPWKLFNRARVNSLSVFLLSCSS